MNCNYCGSTNTRFVRKDWGDNTNPPDAAHYHCERCDRDSYDNAQQIYDEGLSEHKQSERL